MSDFWFSFIPEEPQYELNAHIINTIKTFSWCEDNIAIIVNETVQFASAGSNFERVSCPFCKSDLMNCWGNAMGEAYSKETGFMKLDMITPCCHKDTTLHNLDYYYPQGFYKTIIEVRPYLHQNVIQIPQEIIKDEICQKLLEITDMKWRIIYTRI